MTGIQYGRANFYTNSSKIQSCTPIEVHSILIGRRIIYGSECCSSLLSNRSMRGRLISISKDNVKTSHIQNQRTSHPKSQLRKRTCRWIKLSRLKRRRRRKRRYKPSVEEESAFLNEHVVDSSLEATTTTLSNNVDTPLTFSSCSGEEEKEAPTVIKLSSNNGRRRRRKRKRRIKTHQLQQQKDDDEG